MNIVNQRCLIFNAFDKLLLTSLTREFQKLKYASPQPGAPVALQGRMGILEWVKNLKYSDFEIHTAV